MTRRRRVARLLDRLGLLIFGAHVEAWASTSQADLDAAIDRGARE